MSAYLPGTRIRVLSGRYVGRYGRIMQPPGPDWPDERGQVGVALEAIARTATQPAKAPETKYFGPSQLVRL